MISESNRLRAGLLAALLAVSGFVVGCGRSGESRLEAGLACLRAGHLDEGVRHLEAARKDLAADATLYSNLGVAYWELGRREQAVETLLLAAELESEDPRPLVYLVQMFGVLKRWDDARDAYNEAIKRVETPSARLLTAMALAEHRAGNLEAAVSYLQKALSTEPDYPAALFGLGFLSREQPDTQADAIEYFRRYLGVAPESDHAEAAQNYLEGLTLETQPPTHGGEDTGDTGPATTYVSSPATPMLHKAQQAIRDQVFDEALFHLKEAAKKDPGLPCAVWELAVLYEKHLKDPERARKTYAAFERVFPDDPRSTRQLGTGKQRNQRLARTEFGKGLQAYETGDNDTAIRHYREALKHDNRFVGASYNLGLAYKAKEDYLNARREFIYTLSVHPQMVDANYALGSVYRKLKDSREAIVYLERTLALKPQHARSHMQLGYAYQELNQYAKARMHFERYVEMAPDEPSAKKLKEWLQQSGRRR